MGAQGTCNNVTGFCECPEGFWGMDDYQFYNDCHIDKTVQAWFYIISMFIHIFMIFASFLAGIFLSIHWGYLDALLLREFETSEEGKGSKSRNGSSQDSTFEDDTALSLSIKVKEDDQTDTNSTILKTGSYGSYSSYHQNDDVAVEKKQVDKKSDKSAPRRKIDKSATLKRRAKRKSIRERAILLTCALFLLYGLACVGYYVPMLKGSFRADGYFGIDFACFISVTSIFSGVWLLAYLWFSSLPSIQLYGKLFGIRSVLIENPDMYHWVTVVNVVLIVFMGFLLVLLIPQAAPEARPACNSLLLWCYFFWLSVCSVFINAMVVITYRLFEQLDALNKGEPAPRYQTVRFWGWKRQTATPPSLPSRPERVPKPSKRRDTAFARGLALTQDVQKLSIAVGIAAPLSAILAANHLVFQHATLRFSVAHRRNR